MRLFLADSTSTAPASSATKRNKRARALIKQCGYWRRQQELEDAEEAAKVW